MTIRVVTSPSGEDLTFGWALGTAILPVGSIIDVPRGAELEAAIGVDNLVLLTQQVLDGHAMGGGRGIRTAN